ncbi:hypothetical protein [Brevundimonas aurifodinae]|uniref:Uncharacterized protein n=2 Tax=Brevundimonas TaxID=41275 RepID=A0ABV1NMR6_9CAUL|nr:MAG: hypothetical protein B7Z42_09165 [Brevundimonas sp. 12-68-7]OYX31056.1 MAG: hypothetical protein B7Z01_13250 [Brevundimonas subvibrioides]
MTDRAVRNLANLRVSASTARVLNLLQVWHEHGGSEGWKSGPMFQNPTLNRSLILKHRLRRDEIDRFRVRRHVATKVILPIDQGDLRVGGRYLFVDQIGFDRTLEETFGIGPSHPDRKLLALMDELPGLDPFLLREQLRRNGLAPDACYFNLSPADLGRMGEFVASEIRPLVDLSLGPDTDLAAENPVARLTAKIMSFTPGEDMSALGATLQLEPQEYEEGVFCWKGFLYYKWSLQTIIGDVGGVIEGVRRVRAAGRVDADQHIAIDRAREQVRRRIILTCEAAADMLRVYDDAFTGLTQRGDPSAFRDFLRDAPILFARLGERLGAVQHIVSFWSYRMAAGKPRLTAEELIDLLSDFETSLSGRERPDVVALAA